MTAEDGTGVVHTAIAFGEDDFRLGERYGMTVHNPVLPDGSFDERDRGRSRGGACARPRQGHHRRR